MTTLTHLWNFLGKVNRGMHQTATFFSQVTELLKYKKTSKELQVYSKICFQSQTILHYTKWPFQTSPALNDQIELKKKSVRLWWKPKVLCISPFHYPGVFVVIRGSTLYSCQFNIMTQLYLDSKWPLSCNRHQWMKVGPFVYNWVKVHLVKTKVGNIKNNCNDNIPVSRILYEIKSVMAWIILLGKNELHTLEWFNPCK